MTGTVDVDLLVIGAGPVGLTLANLLGRYGVCTVLIEDRESLIDFPRGVGLDDESLRAFQAAGLVERVLPHTVPNQMLRFVNRRRRLIAEIAPTAEPYGWPRRNGFVQPLVDAELLRGLDRYPDSDVRWSHTLVGLTQQADRVVAEVSGPDGVRRELSARYVVGADGGRSATRRLCNISFDGTTSSTRWLVVDIANDPLGTPNIYVGADPDRPYVSVSIAHGIRRFEFMIKDDETSEQAVEIAFLHRLMAAFVPQPAEVSVIRSRVYTHHSRIAGSFRAGRVLIAGDAAHLMPVWQGQGYNSGIRDAVNLAWKLAAVVKGQAEDRLLDSYDVERRKHAAAMIQISTLVGKVISPTNKAVAAVRDLLLIGASRFPALKRYVVEMRFKPMPRYEAGAVLHRAGSDLDTSPVGKLFIQPRVDTRTDKGILLDEVLGVGFAVVAWGNSPTRLLDDDVIDRWRSVGARFVALLPSPQLAWAGDDDPEVTVVGDATGQLKAWFDDHAESVLVIRPDRCVAAAGIAQDASRISRELFDVLHLTRLHLLDPTPAGER